VNETHTPKKALHDQNNMMRLNCWKEEGSNNVNVLCAFWRGAQQYS